ncbi:MAG: FkbM family methyltransferase [Rubricoccaceae bacterium]|nr:FkbM family methyltransferase [Rubricoccaceae bacterium]
MFTIAQGAWEPHMVVVADRFLRPDQVVIDAGAHIGYFTILAAAKVGPNGRVLAIEPSPLNLSRLKRNLELSEIGGCTTICPVAVGERQGTVTLYSDGNSGGTEFSLYSVRHGGQSAGNVEVRSLDELCIEHNVDTVDFIKIDVEGAELATLVGAQQVMARSPRLKIVVELHPWVVAPEEVCRFLAASGFFLYDLGAGFSRFDAERAQQRFEDGGDVFASKVALPET